MQFVLQPVEPADNGVFSEILSLYQKYGQFVHNANLMLKIYFCQAFLSIAAIQILIPRPTHPREMQIGCKSLNS